MNAALTGLMSRFGQGFSGVHTGPVATPVTTPTPVAGTAVPATAHPASTTNALSPQLQAVNQFANSAGMQFQNQQAANALNNLYAAHGMEQSGAAMKGITDYIANQDLNRYFMPYMGFVQGQQNMGASSAAALAGEGSSFGQTAANINAGLANASANTANNASNAIGQTAANASNAYGANLGLQTGALRSNANALSNGAIANGYANAGLGSAIGSAAGQIGGMLLQPNYGSSYGVPSSYLTSAMNTY